MWQNLMRCVSKSPPALQSAPLLRGSILGSRSKKKAAFGGSTYGIPELVLAGAERTEGRGGLFFFLLLTLAVPVHAQSAPNTFFLHDGDTVVFYGDSITEQQRYTRDVETFVLTRFPEWHVKFINSGWNGDRVSGGEGGSLETRLKRDVLAYHPTVVTILLGMNDGAYTHYDQSAFETYSQGLTHLVDTLTQKQPGVRLTLLTPTYYDQFAPWSRHFRGYNAVLLRYGDFVKKLGAERNIPVVDLNAPMRAATKQGRRRDLKYTLVDDGVHPTEAGHLVIAAALLQVWHAPGLVADVLLDPANPVTVTAPLPWPLPEDARNAEAVSPVPGSLNIFRAHAPLLGGTRWDLLVDGKSVGTFTRPQLRSGLDLASMPALPQNKQAAGVLGIVENKNDRWRYLWKGSPLAIAAPDDAPSDSEALALLAIDQWLDDARSTARTAAQKQTHVFSLRPAFLSEPFPRRKSK